MRRLLVALAVVVGVCVMAQAASWRELLTVEKTQEQATHALTIRHEDLTNTTAAWTQVVAIAQVYTAAVQLASVKLITPFRQTNNLAGNTNLYLRVGDGTAPTYFLGSTSISLSNSPVYLSVNTTSNKLFTAPDTLDATFVPGGTNSLAELSAGEVRIYFNIIQWP
jgi:hypothetical protein